MGSGVKSSSTSLGITACLRWWAVLLCFILWQLREADFGFEVVLGVQPSCFRLSSTCLLLLGVLTGSTGLPQWIWPDWWLPNRTWAELPVSFWGISGDSKVLDLSCSLFSSLFFKLSWLKFEGDLNFTIWFWQEFRRTCFAPVGGCLFREIFGDSDAQDECVADGSTHVDGSNGSALPSVLGDSSKTGEGLDGSAWEVLSVVPTVGFGVCALLGPWTHSFLAVSSECSKSLRLFWDKLFKSTTGDGKRY